MHIASLTTICAKIISTLGTGCCMNSKFSQLASPTLCCSIITSAFHIQWRYMIRVYSLKFVHMARVTHVNTITFKKVLSHIQQQQQKIILCGCTERCMTFFSNNPEYLNSSIFMCCSSLNQRTNLHCSALSLGMPVKPYKE